MEQHHGKERLVRSPWQLFLLLLVTIFLAEAAVMILVMSLAEEHGVWTAIADAAMLVVVSAPLLWYFIVRPLRSTAMAEYMRAATFVTHNTEGIITANEEGLVESFNPAAESLFGYSSQEVLGKPLTLLIPEQYREAHREAFKRLRSTGESSLMGKTVELYGLCKDGSKFPFELSLATWKAGTGARYASTIRDITERKEQQLALLEKTSHIRLLGDITIAANEASTLGEAMPRVLEQICSTIGWPVGHVYLLGGDGAGELVSKGIWYLKDPERFSAFREVTEATPFTVGVGLPGRVLASKKPEWISDVTKDPNFLRASLGAEIGVTAGFGVPVMVGAQAVAVLEFYSDRVIEPNELLLEVMVQVGTQLGCLAEWERSEKVKRLQLNRIRALHEIGTTITSTLDLRMLLDLLLEKVDELLPYSASGVRLMNPETGKFDPITSRNLDEEALEAARAKSGSGLSELVLKNKAPLMISDVRKGSNLGLAEFFSEHGLVSYLGLPLKVGDEILGVLSVLTREGHHFTDDEIGFLSTLTNQAATAIHNSQLYEQVTEKTRSLSALYAITAAANRSLDLDEVLQAGINQFTKTFCFDLTRIFLLDPTNNELHLKVAFEARPGLLNPPRGSPPGLGVNGLVAKSGEAIIFEDVQNDPRYETIAQGKETKKRGFGFLAVFPIKAKGETVGTIICIGKKPRRLTTEEIRLIESVTGEIGVAIENAGLFEKIKVQAIELEKSNRAKEEFLRFVSHELKTPLNVVIGYTTMMHDNAFGEIAPAQEKALEKVLQNSNHLLAMIDSLLNASKAQTETIQIERQGVNLKRLFDELRSNYDFHIEKDLSLMWDYPSELPIIKTDSEKLRHILQNLINNAIKYTDKGHVTISAQHRAETKRVEFRVEDTGIGISREEADSIFERFNQTREGKGRSAGGVGLGLYIVKQFTELLGGEIKLESEPGKGSVFTVAIPMEI